MAEARLYAESFAPWCEKARWALDHRRVSYRFIEHVPLVGEASLRLAARRPFGRVTVPLLVADGQVVMGSLQIARHAEAHGAGPSLSLEQDAVASWDQRSEALMVAGRALLLARMLRSPAALREQVPSMVPAFMRAAVGKAGVHFIVRKHAVPLAETSGHESAIRRVLSELRGALADGRMHLVGDVLSYADVTMAAALQLLLPVDDRYIRLGAATREAWTHHELARDYADLFGWRDRLYAAARY
jgi:glutathione S-transferase